MSASELQKAAFAAGGIAYTAGRPITDCPYTADAPQGLRRLWVRGWVRTQTDAGQDPIPLDEAEVA